MKKILLMIMVFICLLIGCESRDTVNVKSDHRTENSRAISGIEVKKEEKKYKLVEKRLQVSKENKNVSGKAIYPNIEAENESEVIKQFNLRIKQCIEEELSLEEFDRKTDLTLKYEIKTATKDIISVYFSGDEYTEGAAHPNNYGFSFTYDLKQNRELTLSDVTGNKKNWSDNMKENIDKQISDKELAEQLEVAWKVDGESQIQQKHNFYVKNKKIYVRIEIPAGSRYSEYIMIM